MKQPTLEHAAQQIAEATSTPPFLYDLGPKGARKVLDDIQAAPVPKLDVDEKWITVPASAGDVQVRIVTPVGAAIWVTQAPRESVRPFDLAHEDVVLHTRDSLGLAAWYVPSQNGAAVVVAHGGGGTRNGSERHARMLARAGYGVLLYDARGNGESEGRHDAMGWTWEPDVAAAVDFLLRRPDVRGRIGALGISTGAEAVRQAAARDDEIAAVVSDGAIARNLAETRQLAGAEELQAAPYYGILFATIRTLTGIAT